jgi:hypothetical protein
MNDDKMTRERFIELTKSQSWSTTDEYVRLLDSSDFWKSGFVEHALEIAKKDYVRRMVRTIRDENGWPIIASVVTTNDDGEEVRIYKQEYLFNLSDYEQVASYHHERGIYHMHMANGYVIRANERFNQQMHLPFPGKEATD